ncbi:hypothetical protein PG985_008864 [Apiospora marii]|uniref:Uncharacterized protein n=1 Tax=Apiospora marii TaxID=335849 RepID=A0ABR1RBB1_9PEZI
MKPLVFLAALLACSSSLAEACTRTWMYYRTQTDLATRMNTTTAWYEAWDEGQLVCSGRNVTEKEPYFSNRFADGWCYDSESAIWLYAGGSTSTATYSYGGKAFSRASVQKPHELLF